MPWIFVDDAVAIAERKAAGELTTAQAIAMAERVAAGHPLQPSSGSSELTTDVVDRIRALVAAGELTPPEGDEVLREVGRWP